MGSRVTVTAPAGTVSTRTGCVVLPGPGLGLRRAGGGDPRGEHVTHCHEPCHACLHPRIAESTCISAAGAAGSG